ncbi:uncharacterized protein LOC112325464 isoform X1 [Populus trichocarpa]|uniref:uncharacterized protein LOC112325464 isoform X1 n=1 Tax=Populus trichocarpa TaxID=3694 RepID=UPI000D18A5A3|nr:uncharacterized protein LOC112325464 isoform X1 [Populus trichocarpa]|eukprot:XP_024447826.1 uncharacterized protein LOC112325464 [Populus trichocarpa]
MQERKWESDTGFSLRCMKRQISSTVTTHIPQTVRSRTVIMFFLMYSGGHAVRNHNHRRSCSQLGSHWNMLRCWRRILTGRMCNGHKLVFGLLEKNTHLLGCAFYLQVSYGFMCIYK